jgi:hypothetical protein
MTGALWGAQPARNLHGVPRVGRSPPLARQVEIEQGTLICTMRGRIWRATAPRGDLAGDPRGQLPPMDLSCYLEAIMDEGGQRRGKDRQRK